MMTEKECRICFENDNEFDFINPCLCDGTSKWVHNTCLQEWRNSNTNMRANKFCIECNYKYKTFFKYPKEKYIIKKNFPRKYKLTYMFFIYITSMIFCFFLTLIDKYNNNLSIKIVNFDNGYYINNTNLAFKNNEMYRGMYYQSLTITIYCNLFLIFFFIVSLLKIKRKSLYFKLMYKYSIIYFIQTNNIFYTLYIFNFFKIYELGFFFQGVVVFYCIDLTIELLKKNNNIIDKMNIKFNKETMLKYDENISESSHIIEIPTLIPIFVL